jgi:y4mF family transcriptional regulator
MAAKPRRSGIARGVNVSPLTLEDLRHRAQTTNAVASATKSCADPTLENPTSLTPLTPPGTYVNSAAELGRLIKTSREQMDLNQQQFADVAGVGRRFISELENGKATLEFDRVLQVSKAAGIDLYARQRSAR